ncbi:tau 95 subunit of transcription factor TFIIIC [Ceratobasidium sp. 395]|nr:tau 95 subunit of transcription factor TFIIIC [Ceratobasidium sp. 395]
MASDSPPSSPPLPALQDLLQSGSGHQIHEEESSTRLKNVHPPLPSTSAPTQASPAQNLFYSVEYPGYVKSVPSSTAHAVRTMGGQKALDHVFGESGRILELRLQPDNPFAHPVTGDVVATNKLLVKVVARRKKKTMETYLNGAALDSNRTETGITRKGKGKDVGTDAQVEESSGTYTAEIVGIIPKTVRFRSMADFQFQPDEDDYIVQMRHAMDRLDVDAVQSFELEPLRENYGSDQSTPQSSTIADPNHMDMDIDPNLPTTSTTAITKDTVPKSQLKLIPPPLFSRQGIPQHYNLKQNPMSVIHTTVDPITGEETRRYIHKHRLKGSMAPAAISWENEKVPTEPPKHILDAKAQAKPHLLAKLRELFEQRPVWSRIALVNQFPALEGREIQNTKVHIALVSYTFSDGAWRDTLLRLGYDPRKDPQARLLLASDTVISECTLGTPQMKMPVENPLWDVERGATIQPSARSKRIPENDHESHIFDGKTLHAGAASFQLCDITDSLLVPLINDARSLRQEPDIADGWYTSHEFALIKAVVRRKHFNLLQGKVISDKDCADLFVPGGLASSNTVVRPASSTAGKKFLRKARGNRRPVAPEKLMAAELEIALRKEREMTDVMETPRLAESEVEDSADPGEATDDE